MGLFGAHMAMLGRFWAGSDYLGRFRTGSGQSGQFCDGLSRSGRSGPVRDRSGGLDRFNSANRFPLSCLSAESSGYSKPGWALSRLGVGIGWGLAESTQRDSAVFSLFAARVSAATLRRFGFRRRRLGDQAAWKGSLNA